MNERPRVGYTCSYTPLPLIHAAGFTPWRILPVGDPPDQAGTVLHDNLCPEVKRVLDRKLAGELPELAGTVFVNSCDAMRRLAQAWVDLVPAGQVFLMDLPSSVDELAVRYQAVVLEQLRQRLGEWAGQPVEDAALVESVRLYDELQRVFEDLARLTAEGVFPGGRTALQGWYNRAAIEPIETILPELQALLGGAAAGPSDGHGVPLALFGNVLPEVEAMALIEDCGARIVVDDLCTGARQFTRVDPRGDAPLMEQLATAVLARPLCARTLLAGDADALARQVVAVARAANARGAVAHVMKFCDPYLVRMPALREAFQAAEMPLLVLEGDCTLRSLGQQRTRIEAFVEMLGD
jgi:benzoyl-CoA reductase/2-hydroxyglutaryl-CoA dehydratase subunit BcrC/BadD/HgdB